MVIPQPTLIYHITHVDNLEGIIEDGGLRCCADLRRAGASYRDIANSQIQDRRARKRVPCGPGGVLHDYVPFYFAPRSPMLYAIHRGNVPTYSGGQEPVVYLVSTVEAIQDAASRYAFTDGHATIMTSAFFDDVADLGQVDWSVMRSRYWNDTNQYPDRERRRQAEFLVHRFFPWELVISMAVVSAPMRARAGAAVGIAAPRPRVEIRPGWYYS